MNTISFVVDKIPLHYYQAELLLHSLEQNSSYKKKDIVVQCLSRVDKDFIDFLKKNSYTYNIIEPYLDGKYCNKLQQLEYFKDKEIDGVILMDTDMFVLSDLSEICGDKIMAKIVDAPNPSLATLKGIYKKAALPLAEIVCSDWDLSKNETLKNNFNGGFYYIPKNQISIMSVQWKRWAEWLYAKPELFDDAKKFIHVDQISFSLALESNSLGFKELSANYNFPIHSFRNISSYDETKEIKIIHYHREIDDFGLLKSSKLIDARSIEFIDKANQSILKKDIIFYSKYKKSIVPNLKFSKKVLELDKRLSQFTKDKKLKLIFHAGTPKTGTTSLQLFLNKNQEVLIEQGYIYSQVELHPKPPKHQWIVSTLLSNNFEKFILNLEKVYAQAIDAKVHTIILSSEGIYNHWWDYDAQAKALLQSISKYFDLKLWVSFRSQQSFLESFYKQNLKNPQIKSVDCYGKDLSLEDALNDSWFLKRLDYLGFVYDCEYLFGKQNVKILTYSNHMIKDFCTELGVDLELVQGTRENESLCNISIELLRVINRYNLNTNDKTKIIKELSNCDEILKNYSSKKISHNSSQFNLQSQILFT